MPKYAEQCESHLQTVWGIRPLVDVNASRTISGVGVAAAGTAKELQVLSTGTLKFVAAALMNKNVAKEFKTLGEGIKNQISAAAKPVQDSMLQLFKYISSSIKTMGPLFHTFFAAVAPLVTIIGQGLVQAVANLVGEFTPLVRVVTPIVKELFAQLPDLIGNIASGLNAILSPLSSNTKAFGQLLGTIGALLPMVGGIIGSLVRLGQQIMPMFSRTLLMVVSVLQGGLAQVLAQVGNAINKMLPAIGVLAQALFPALVGLVSVVGQLVKGIQPLLPSLVYLAVWISKVANNLLSAIIPIVTALLAGLLPALKVVLPIIISVANTVGNALAEAFRKAQPSLVLLARAVGQILTALAPLIPVVVAAALSFLPIIPAAAKIASVLAQGLVPIVLALTPLLVFLAPTLVKIAIATKLWAVAQGILNVILALNPIGAVIVAIVALVAAIVFIATKTRWFQNIWNASWGFIKRIVMDVWDWVKGHWPLLLAILTGPIGAATILIIRNWGRIKDAASSAFTAIVSWFKGLPGRITGAIGNLGKLLTQAGKDLLSGLWSGIKSMWETVKGWFTGFPAKILSALGIHSPPDWAISAGKHIMGGLLKGLAHGAADVAGFFKGLASDVLGPLKGIWGAISGPMPAGGNYASVVDLAKAMVGARWGMGQWDAFNRLEMAEAGYNVYATNPSSGAFGLPQALPKSKLPPAALSGSVMSMAVAQLGWMFDYIAGRYGNPAGAWAHEQAFNWYGTGLPPTLFSRPTLLGVGDRPETVSITPGRRGGATVVNV